jgi:hypothetical protein
MVQCFLEGKALEKTGHGPVLFRVKSIREKGIFQSLLRG